MGSTTILISDENKKLLVELGGALQMKKKKKVSMNDVITELIENYKGLKVVL